jgi:secondary thiamine-phosphate synthase enzyme
VFQTQIQVRTKGQGLYAITDAVKSAIEGHLPQAGLLNCFITHTSASLLIQENFDPTAKQDLEEFFSRLAPEHQEWHRHTVEGPDDTTSHLKAALTETSLVIPIRDSQLGLGTWQGIYLFEHRTAAHERKIILTVMG